MSGLRTQRSDPAKLDELLLRMAGGDELAFEKLHAATRRKLFSTVLLVVRRRHLAEDIAQEAYVRIWLNAPAYRPALGSPMMWMITIARNLAIDAVRRPSREIFRDQSALLDFPADTPTALESMERRENESDTARLQQSMLSALQTLEPTRRHLVIAAYLHGESRHRLAEQYGVPANTIRTWLRRALMHVRAQIGAMPPGHHGMRSSSLGH
ncbi:sigma-70 family RNA polymerase sigma factor [Bradyrhizobium japonicum]|jgi:RNA polymerase sigma-70 factor (ECF subfamily)|uniref:RNA polymerase sigma factor n=1 Tax=Bradyrhizobium japonicum TaxID=375 RepID=UPI001BA8C563|nr:sigma-70 family RNA polymerase sigma factor [Bradyrhizobium japonicum]MBR0993162.1 sigma-70 family RNA polymerase sigma factor [Bradyrhizobium japonicum]